MRLFNKNPDKGFSCDMKYIKRKTGIFDNVQTQLKLSIGDTFSKEFITVGFDNADFCGDIRGIWRSDDYDVGNIRTIPEKQFKFIKMQHFIEHIEWIYQKDLFEWVKTLLADDGVMFIETPNLEFICSRYMLSFAKYSDDKTVSYPPNQHPDLKEQDWSHFNKWVNFKLFSGASLNDHHSCLHDRYSIYELLNTMGFANIKVYASETLFVVADNTIKDSVRDYDLDNNSIIKI